MSLLATRHLTKHFGDLCAVDDVDFSVEPGELVALVGSNGAGKTTLVNLISGQIPPDSGTIEFRGTDVTSHSVNGRIRAKEVIVETNWSDYVFEPGYRLASLSEVEQHIRAHGTLPGVPSGADVAKEGVSLGDMQARLLQKVEELTLHVIAQEKRIQKLEEENQQLRSSR